MQVGRNDMQEILLLAQEAGPSTLQDLDKTQKAALKKMAKIIQGEKKSSKTLSRQEVQTLNTFLESQAAKRKESLATSLQPRIHVEERLQRIAALAKPIVGSPLEQEIDKAVETFRHGSIQEKLDTLFKEVDNSLDDLVNQKWFIEEMEKDVDLWKMVESHPDRVQGVRRNTIMNLVDIFLPVGITNAKSLLRRTSDPDKRALAQDQLRELQEIQTQLKSDFFLHPDLADRVANLLTAFGDSSNGEQFLRFAEQAEQLESIEKARPKDRQRIFKNIIKKFENDLKVLRPKLEELNNAIEEKKAFRKTIDDEIVNFGNPSKLR